MERNDQTLMVEHARTWIKENSTLIYFLVAQVIAIGAAGASIIAYMVKLETRVSIMETRGAEYTVARMSKIDERLTVIEQKMASNEGSIKRLVDQFLRDPK
jgi:exopolysaccharide biosynthesis protein